MNVFLSVVCGTWRTRTLIVIENEQLSQYVWRAFDSSKYIYNVYMCVCFRIKRMNQIITAFFAMRQRQRTVRECIFLVCKFWIIIILSILRIDKRNRNSREKRRRVRNRLDSACVFHVLSIINIIGNWIDIMSNAVCSYEYCVSSL